MGSTCNLHIARNISRESSLCLAHPEVGFTSPSQPGEGFEGGSRQSIGVSSLLTRAWVPMFRPVGLSQPEEGPVQLRAGLRRWAGSV